MPGCVHVCVYSGLIYRMLLGPTVIVFNYIFVQKLKRRQVALWKTNALSDEEKNKWAVCLKMELMSSKESDGSDEEDEEKASFTKRPIPWRSEKVTSLFLSLDRKFNKTLTKRSIQMTQSRKTGLPSDRPKPDLNDLDLPDWALNV